MKRSILNYLVLGLGICVLGSQLFAQCSSADSCVTTNKDTDISPAGATAKKYPEPKALPKMIDLGAGACIPCKAMKPILEQATIAYSGQAEIVFIDVWKDRSIGSKYGIRTIPTQIFYDTTGKEVWRHEGFLGREDIDKKFAELGVNLPSQEASSPTEGKNTEIDGKE